MNNNLKKGLWLIFIGVIAYNSVYFRKLDEVKKGTGKDSFDAKAYSKDFYQNQLLKNADKALEINDLISKISNNPEASFKEYGHALGIGNIGYFLVKAKGKITKINENTVEIDVSGKKYIIATEFIFGNAVRDAAGIIQMTTFENTMDFNNVSAALNEIIRKEVVPNFKKNAVVGKEIDLVGALELNQKHLKLSEVEIVPIKFN
jgi:predicted lipoprotein